jgi:tetratricopeptide (TPR) repeat protein
MDNVFESYSHFDLLHPVRRLWGRRLDNCSLGTVEKNVIGFGRENDVPGWMIPSLYFEYLQNGSTAGIEHIFHHNLLDILSLVVLASRACHVVREPCSTERRNGLDFYSLGRLFDQGGEVERSIECYLNSLECHVPPSYHQDALKKLSFAYKRIGDWERATKIWTQVIEHGNDFELYPYEELAKYYEHRMRNYRKAIDIVDRALSTIETIRELRGLTTYDEDEADLRYRLNRLRHKENGEWSALESAAPFSQTG